MTDETLRVYIADPYQGGDWGANIRAAVEAAEAVWQAGHVPFVPHTETALWSVLVDRTGHDWLGFDLAWLDACDALVRIDGESPGAEKEIDHAEAEGIPVYYGVEEFLEEVTSADD